MVSVAVWIRQMDAIGGKQGQDSPFKCGVTVE